VAHRSRFAPSPSAVFWVNLAVGLALFAYILFAYGARALAILSLDFSPVAATSFVAVAGSSIVCLAWRWGFILRGLSEPPALLALTMYRSAAHSLAVLVPSAKMGGDPLRAWLAARAGVPAPHAVAGTVVDRALEIGASIPFSIIFAVVLVQSGVPQLEKALVTMVAGAAALMFGVVFAIRRLRRGSGLASDIVRMTRVDRWSMIDTRMHIIEGAEEAIFAVSQQRRRMVEGFAVGLLGNLLVIGEFALLLHAFGLPADTVAIFGAIFATAAAHMLPIPVGVGVLEGAQVWMFDMLGYSADVGLAVGLVVRFRELLWMAPGLIYLAVRRKNRSAVE
jgi:uncharacterized protein (TIRG00374 family)